MPSYSAELELKIEDAKAIAHLLGSGKALKRSRITVRGGKGKLVIEVQASDMTALLGSLNSMVKKVMLVASASSLVSKS